jgi:ferric-dicitrate binding protein FerR (iron transport regulator)
MKDLIIHYFKGELNQEQKIRFFEQLSADPEAQKEFAGMQNTVALAGLSVSGNDAELAEKYLNDFRKKRRKKILQKFSLIFSKYAAIITAVFFITQYYTANHPAERENNLLTVPAGQRAKLTLNDGTTVWLNSRSTLSYPGTFSGDTRKVILDGEAYFDVARDEKKAFIVETKQFDIRVFGTEFNVSAYGDDPLSEVALLKGSVEVKPAGNPQAYRMAENEKVSFRNNRMTVSNRNTATREETLDPLKNNKLEKIKTGNGKLSVSSIKNYDYFKWREGLICFDNETVENIMKKLEIYYDIRIETKKPTLLKQRYSGKFRTQDGIEQVIKVLQLEHKFTYKRDNEINLITIK